MLNNGVTLLDNMNKQMSIFLHFILNIYVLKMSFCTEGFMYITVID